MKRPFLRFIALILVASLAEDAMVPAGAAVCLKPDTSFDENSAPAGAWWTEQALSEPALSQLRLDCLLSRLDRTFERLFGNVAAAFHPEIRMGEVIALRHVAFAGDIEENRGSFSQNDNGGGRGPAPKLLIPSERERVLSALRAAPFNVAIPNEKLIPTAYLEDALQALRQIRDPRLVQGLTLRMPYWLNGLIFTAGLAGFVIPRANSLSVAPFPFRRLFQRFFAHELGHVILFNFKRLYPDVWREFESRSWTAFGNLKPLDKTLSIATFASALTLAGYQLLLIVGGNLGLGAWTSLGLAAALLAGGLLFSAGGGLIRQWLAIGNEFSKWAFDPTKPLSVLTAYSLANADEEGADLMLAAFTQPQALVQKAEHNSELGFDAIESKLQILESHIFVDGYFNVGQSAPLQAAWWSLGWPGPRAAIALLYGIAGVWLLWEPAAQILDFPLRLLMVLAVPILFTILQGPEAGLHIHLAALAARLPEGVNRAVKRAVSAPVRAGFEFLRLTMFGNLLLALLFIIAPETIRLHLPPRPAAPPGSESREPLALQGPGIWHPAARLRQSVANAASALNQKMFGAVRPEPVAAPPAPKPPESVTWVAPPWNGPYPKLLPWPVRYTEVLSLLELDQRPLKAQPPLEGGTIGLDGRFALLNGYSVSDRFSLRRDRVIDKLLIPYQNSLGGEIEIRGLASDGERLHPIDLGRHPTPKGDGVLEIPVRLDPVSSISWYSIDFTIAFINIPKEAFRNHPDYEISHIEVVYFLKILLALVGGSLTLGLFHPWVHGFTSMSILAGFSLGLGPWAQTAATLASAFLSLRLEPSLFRRPLRSPDPAAKALAQAA